MNPFDDSFSDPALAMKMAKFRVAFGSKNFRLTATALDILNVGRWSKAVYGWLDAGLDASEVVDEKNKYMLIWVQCGARELLRVALTNPQKLRLIAERLVKLQGSDKPWSNVNDHLLTALEAACKTCGDFPPTIGQLRDAFFDKYDEQYWPGEWPARKRLQGLGIPPLRKSRPGPTKKCAKSKVKRPKK